MAIPGTYTLFYDWSSTGSYSSTSMNIAAAGTWTNGQGYSGTWEAANGMLIFQFNNSKTTYAGNVIPHVVTGICSAFSGGTNAGSFYLLSTTGHFEKLEKKHANATADSSGAK
jgi:hypothetical protein